MTALLRNDGTLITLRTHRREVLKSGEPLSAEFAQPVIVKLDEEFAYGRLCTFYESPAFIGTKNFHQALVDAGVKNIETAPVVIENHITGTECHGYVLMNIIGRVACADMSRSLYKNLGPGMTIINELVLKSGDFGDLHLFVAEEDTDIMIISEKVYKHLSAQNYPDILFRQL